MADKKISALTAATTPLAGTEVLPIVQGGTTVKVSIDNVTAGRDISASGATVTKNGVAQVYVQNTSGTTKNTQVIFSDSVGPKWRIGMDVFTNNGTNELQVYSDTAGTSPFSIDTSSNVKLPVGNLIVGTAGKGIDFSANANAPGMTSELLTWYEEGTWTGSLVGDAAAPATPVTVSGRYTRIGRQVTVQISFSNVNTTGASGVLLITGLPFSSSAERSYGSCFFIGMGSAPATAYIQSSDNRISFLDAVIGAYINISAGAGKYVGAAITYTV